MPDTKTFQVTLTMADVEAILGALELVDLVIEDDSDDYMEEDFASYEDRCAVSDKIAPLVDD